jgi:hypothetical protein
MEFPGNGGVQYQVYCSGAVTKSIEELQYQASLEGRGQATLEALRRAVRQMQQTPNRFGEALYRLPVLRMEIRTAVIRPIAVDFGVCIDRPLVFIKGVRLLGR